MIRKTRLLARSGGFAALLLLLLSSTACGAAGMPAMASQAPSMMAAPPGAPMAESAQSSPMPAPMAAMAASPVAGAPASPASPSTKGQSASAPSAPQKGKETTSDTRAALVVYTGALAMLTESGKVPESIDKIIDVAESLGGGLMGRRDDGVDIRVPSQQFRIALKELERVAIVTTRSVKAEDVTEQVHDLEVRLSNLKATQKRLQEFLLRAQNVNDALTVERELERVAKEIDTIEGRVTFLKNRASFSQISVSLREKPRDTPIVVATPTPKSIPAAQTPNLPVPWLDSLGLDPLLVIKKN
jgi:hypothetical protein